VVVAPTSTFDRVTAVGDVVIEQRDPAEVTAFGAAYNPAFDVTPPHLVTALVTERGVVAPVGEVTLRSLHAATPTADP
jgi:methylthioribose-1-phosphate isomerase